MKADTRILMVFWDAAEPNLIEKWTTDGTLPNLARLRRDGAYGRLDSTADWLVGSPWPTFVTGAMPHDHGLFHFLQWDPDRLTCVRPSPEGRPKPFWHTLGEKGKRSLVLDLPMTFTPCPFNGMELSGWATHDRFAKPASYPRDLMPRLRREFGRPFLPEEHYGRESRTSLLALRDELLATTSGITDIALALMQREHWDLFVFALGATHRGGHKLWDLSKQLREVYIACDNALGRLLAAAPEDATVMVGSLHGMGPNNSRSDVLHQMLERVLSGPGDDPIPPAPGMLRRLTGRVPESWRLAVKHCLPTPVQDRLTSRFFMGDVDWQTTRAFPVIADLHGYVQCNLRGREAAGIVDPSEFDQLCDTLIEALPTFVDADTGDPVVSDVQRTDVLFPDGARRKELPDLLVRWTPTSAARHRAIVSPRFGTIGWPDPGNNPDGRAGNHRPEGFLLAVGNRIPAGAELRGHIADLAATLFSRLGVDQPPDLGGVPIPGLGLDSAS